MNKVDVQNFPAKIASRLSGGAARSTLVKLVNDPDREMESTEIQQKLDVYDGNLLTFHYEEEGRWIYVQIDSKHNGAFSTESDINDLLKDPTKISVDPQRRARARTYSRFVSDGRTIERYPSSGSQVTLGFQVRSDVRDRDRIFDSFWMKFRPILKYLHELE